MRSGARARMYGRAPQRSTGCARQSETPRRGSAWGFLPCELRRLRAHWGVGGRGRAGDTLKISGAALQTANALWCNAIAPWYVVVLLGRPALARHLFARRRIGSIRRQRKWIEVVKFHLGESLPSD